MQTFDQEILQTEISHPIEPLFLCKKQMLLCVNTLWIEIILIWLNILIFWVWLSENLAKNFGA